MSGWGILCATSTGTWIHLPVGFFHELFLDHDNRGRDFAYWRREFGEYRLQRVLLESQKFLTIFGYLAILPNNIITMPEVVLLSY